MSGLSRVCTLECALKLVRLRQQRDQDRAFRVERVRLKTRQQWLYEAQNAANQYIKERDREDACISCGRYHDGQWHCGHYRTTKACPELRFDEDNMHKQCQPCNTHLSGNLVEYRLRLLQKIGPDRLARLEGFHPPRKYTIEELQGIKKEYQQKLRELRKQNAT